MLKKMSQNEIHDKSKYLLIYKNENSLTSFLMVEPSREQHMITLPVNAIEQTSAAWS